MVFSNNWNDVYPSSLSCGDGPTGTSCSPISGFWGKTRATNPRIVDRENKYKSPLEGSWASANFKSGNGNAAVEIQRHLNDYIQIRLEGGADDTPYFLTMDGILGAASDSAIKYFQRNNGLKDDGIVGLATWTKLRDVPPT